MLWPQMESKGNSRTLTVYPSTLNPFPVSRRKQVTCLEYNTILPDLPLLIFEINPVIGQIAIIKGFAEGLSLIICQHKPQFIVIS